MQLSENEHLGIMNMMYAHVREQISQYFYIYQGQNIPEDPRKYHLIPIIKT